MIQPISGSSVSSTQAPQAVAKKDNDGDHDGSSAAAASVASKIGPAVVLSLSNTAKAGGDADHDGDSK